MSLFFLNPAYLFGLLAASAPIIIHLLNRRRIKRIRFPAVKFLLLSQKRISRTKRLRHWFLLALRTFAILMLVLLLARPIFQTGAGLFASGGPSSVALVLDNSLSMTWSRDGDGFKQAKDAAARLFASMAAGDRAALIETNPPTKEPPRLKGEKEVLLRELEGAKIADGSADFAAALARAYELLREPAAGKEIWVVTDAALTDWDRFTLAGLKQYDPAVAVKVIKVGAKEQPPNAAVREIRLSGQDVNVGLPTEIQAVITNFGADAIKDVLVQLRVDDQAKEQKLVSLAPRGEAEANFQFLLTRPGSHTASVALKKDRLAGSPVVHFTLEAEDKIKLMIVDGDPQTSLVSSETFFLTRALNPEGAATPSPFIATVVLAESLASASLESYQAVVLCNVAAISDAVASRLKEYVRRGGGLLIFLGDRVQPEDYNRRLYDAAPSILPARLKDKRIVSASALERIERIDTKHPALAAFSDPILLDSLKSSRIAGYYRTDASGGTAMIGLANGDALALEKKFGAGRVILVSTAADRDWSDLPVKTAYLPLTQSLVNYLQGGKKGALETGVAVGETKKFTLPPAYVGKTLKVIRPDQREREITLAAEGENAAGAFDENNVAGIYRVSAPLAGDAAAALAPIYPVNPPFLESRLEAISDAELAARLRPARAEIVSIDALAKGGSRSDLALPLLLVLIVTLVSEGWLAQRFYG
ncbi:MAG TPA: BatA domain-containing protein [Verrucomicrobiae bacterium]|nr:BatA domain-containing protein [Verrucomicrobiae bacterium]